MPLERKKKIVAEAIERLIYDLEKADELEADERARDMPKMADRRYAELMRGDSELTDLEMSAGWHFCVELDGALTNAQWPGHGFCTCFKIPLIKECEDRQENVCQCRPCAVCGYGPHMSIHGPVVGDARRPFDHYYVGKEESS